jgi:hypothetical protein
MKNFIVLSASVCLLLIICAAILIPDTGTTVHAAQGTSTPTPEETEPGYTNYSGYYRMRCWPACHTKDIPESLTMHAAQETSTPTPEETEPGYTNYSGYYRMRCWPACHTKDIPESVKKGMETGQKY